MRRLAILALILCCVFTLSSCCSLNYCRLIDYHWHTDTKVLDIDYRITNLGTESITSYKIYFNIKYDGGMVMSLPISRSCFIPGGSIHTDRVSYYLDYVTSVEGVTIGSYSVSTI